MRGFRSTGAFALALTLLLAPASLLLAPASFGAQQAASGKKKVPLLTTDDVLTRKTVQVTEEVGADPGAAESGGGSKPETARAQPADGKTNPEEASWRDRLARLRARAESLEREAEQAELRLTELRNELGTSGQSPKYRNEVAAELDQAGPRLAELRSQARAAAAELNELLDQGRQKGFAEGAGPKASTGDGRPNEQYYRQQFAKLSQALEDAQRRIQLYENRVRDLGERMNNPSTDRFSAAQLQQDREEAQQKIREAREALAKAQADLESLMEQARRAGVPPGIFR